MALTITNAYVIKIIDYQLFDQIVTFLDDKGNKFSLMALGSRRIASKNGRHLIVGNYNEVEYFGSRSYNKVGKLKKTVTVKPIPWHYHDYLSFNVLNEYVNMSVEQNRAASMFYKNILEIMHSSNYNDYALLIRILIFIVENNGLATAIPLCHLCQNRDVQYLEKGTYCWVCQNCYDKNKNNVIIFSNKIVLILKDLIKYKKTDLKADLNETKRLILLLDKIISDLLGISLHSMGSFKKSYYQQFKKQ